MTRARYSTDDRENRAEFPASCDTFAMTQVGQVTSRGIELEAIHDFGNGLSLFGNGAYTDATISDDPTFDGNAPARVPELAASVYTQYEFAGIEGLSVGVGAGYTGSRFSDVSNSIDLDALTLLDASVSHKRDDWRASLVARNLADTRDVAFCGAATLPPSTISPFLTALDASSGSRTYTAGREISLTSSRRF